MDKILTKQEIVNWLKENNEHILQNLWKEADSLRRKYAGDEVFFRGIIEISNYCQRRCRYCGINATNKTLKRYLMSIDEIMQVVHTIKRLGYGTVVLQSGEHPRITRDWTLEIIKRIKNETGLAVTLSLGERHPDELEAWHQAGADRYLLKFETASILHFNKIHPPKNKSVWKNRFEILKFLKEIGYETGSGIMLGLPGQTYEEVADAILLFKELELDMIGNGPFIPHPETPLWEEFHRMANQPNQVTNDALTACKVTALTRIVCPKTNIPSTTALATIDPKEGRINGLRWGANVIMPNFTPACYRQWYQIYPGKSKVIQAPEEQHQQILKMLAREGRLPGQGKGSSLNFLQRQSLTQFS